MGNGSLEKVAQELKSVKSALIFAHENPDGDAIGSCVAAGLALKKLGISVDYAVDGDTKNFKQLLCEMEAFKGPIKEAYDAALILDCSTVAYIDNNEYLSLCKKKLLLDHHMTNEGFADCGYIDSSAAATGEVVFELIKLLNVEMEKQMAKALYLALHEDTGGFCHGNTTSRTHAIVSALYKVEPSLYEITQWLNYYDKSRLELIKLALNHLKFYYDNRMCIITFTYGNGFFPYKDENTEKLIDLGKHVRGCQLAVFIRQNGEDVYKVSLRCVSDSIDIASLSKSYGGGGHIRAAGFTFKGKLDELTDMLIRLGEKL